MKPYRILCLLASTLLIVACGGSGTADVSERLTLIEDPLPPAEPQPEPGEDFRVFLVGASPVQMIPSEGRALRNGNDNFPINSLRDQVDLVKAVADYVGIPFELFEESETPPEDHPWTRAAVRLTNAIRAVEVPIILQLGFVRRSMVGQAIVDEDGELAVDLTWAPSCFEFTTPEGEAVGNAYVNYARWLSERMQPEYVVSFSEANLYYSECGGATESWDALVDIQQRAYDAIKEVSPDSNVFASFNIEALYNDTLDGWDEDQYQALSEMFYDTFSMAAYPFGIRREDGSFITPYDLPDDYLTRVLDRHPEEKRLSMAETGWNNVSIAVGDSDQCFEGFPYSEANFAADYLDFVINSAHEAEFEFLSWFSFRDVLPLNVMGTCYVRTDSTDPDNDDCLGDFWCQAVNQAKNTVSIPGASDLFSEVVLKAFGAMGLLDYNGEPRELMLEKWRQVLELPLQHELAPDSEESASDAG